MPQIQGLIFDMDGVIVDTIDYHYLSWKRLGEEEGIAFSREQNDQIRGRSREDSLRFFLQGRELDDAEFQHWMQRKNAFFQEYIQQITPADTLPGVRQILDDARTLSLKIGVGSASRNTKPILTRLGLIDVFDAVGDALAVVHKKPAPDIFLWTAGGMGLNPAHILVFEDSSAGVEAAHRGGFYTVGLGDAGVNRAHLHYPDLSEVRLTHILRELEAASEDQSC